MTITVPLDLITNETTRKHLLYLPRLAKLNLHLRHLSLALAAFLAALPYLTSLTLVVPVFSLDALLPFAGVNAGEQPLGELVIYALRLDDVEATRAYILRDERLGRICTLYGSGAGQETQLVYAPDGTVPMEVGGKGERKDAKGEVGGKGTGEIESEKEHWERTTRVKLFGGLVNVTMESRK